VCGNVSDIVVGSVPLRR